MRWPAARPPTHQRMHKAIASTSHQSQDTSCVWLPQNRVLKTSNGDTVSLASFEGEAVAPSHAHSQREASQAGEELHPLAPQMAAHLLNTMCFWPARLSRWQPCSDALQATAFVGCAVLRCAVLWRAGKPLVLFFYPKVSPILCKAVCGKWEGSGDADEEAHSRTITHHITDSLCVPVGCCRQQHQDAPRR